MKALRQLAVFSATACLGCGAAKPAAAPADAATPETAAADSAQQPETAGPPDAAANAETAGAEIAAEVAANAVCAHDQSQPVPFTPAATGTLRHETAGPFTMELADGTTFDFEKSWTGCDVYAFVPDTLAISELAPASVWTKDVKALLQKSPKNVHWFFVSRQSSADAVQKAVDGMQERVLAALNDLGDEQGAYWLPRVHVAKKSAVGQGNWIGAVLNGHGKIGFGIDRTQKIRGFGMLADVTRQDAALQNAKKWPWLANLAYAAHEPLAWNAEHDRNVTLAAQKTTQVELWKGETLEQFAETDANLPGAPTMATFDTLQVEIEMRCPNPTLPEPGNCGAWDYIAGLSVQGADGKMVEIARFITSYHRETHWLVDATPMLALLQAGGKRHFRWEYAPEWNKQPTATYLRLHLSNQGKPFKPKSATYLWGDAAWNSKYDAAHADQSVAIAPTTKKTELWVIVTGHGADKATQCAEFCNHQHQFAVNGQAHLLQFPMAGTQDQCMPNLTKGMTPNQGGTWWFGRGGWCPGMQVDPWAVDVTAEAPAGKTATLTYKGLLAGKTPPDGEGNIHLTSYLVQYE